MMDINYELYKVFYYVAISLSFSDASKQLFISQSAVSQSVKVLEKKLGITLFIRSTKRVQLTPEGEKFDPNFHQAMFEVPNPDIPANTVVQVVQPGYSIGERVLRPAMVGVSRGGPARTADAGPAGA